MNRGEMINNRFELLNYVNKGIFITDQKFIILFWNKDLEEKTEILNSEIVGNSLIEQFQDFNNENFKNKIKNIFNNKYQIEIIFENDDEFFPSVLSKNYKRKFSISLIPSLDNSQNYLMFSLELNVSSLYDHNENIAGRIGSFRDITKRKEIEDRLHENEEKFRSISLSAQDAIIMMDNDGNISFWNKAAEKMFNYSYQEAIGKYLHKFITPDQYFQEFKKGFPEFQKSGKGNVVGKTLELTALKKDGTEFLISLSLSAVKLKGKWNALGIIRDISQIKAAAAELQQSEQNFKALAENSFECIAINDKDGNYLYSNIKTSEITGYSNEELLKLNVKDLTPPKDVEIVMKRVRDRIEDKSALKYFESNLLLKDGRIIPIEILATKTEWHEKPADMVFFHDISKRKQAEEILRQSEQRLKIALDIASAGLWELNLQTNELYIGPNILKLLGYEKDDKTIKRLDDLHNPNNWLKIKEQFNLS